MRTNKLSRSISTVILLVCILRGIVIAAPMPSEVKSVVAFVYVTGNDGNLVPNGTGFLVGVENPSDPNIFAVYMVTAKHVLYKPKTTKFFDKVYIRLNKKDGSSEFVTTPIKPKGRKRTVFVHNDSSVDIAVIPFLPNRAKFDFQILPDNMITTKETYKELKIREGSDVFFTGLFAPYPGAERNYPVVRFGRVALVTDEKIEWKKKQMDLYLIEIGSYGGNSGAPVFFYLGSDREPGNLIVSSPILKLAGVMQGTFLDAHEIKVAETKKVPYALSSMGIAAVVPGYKLHEILFSKELKKKRGF